MEKLKKVLGKKNKSINGIYISSYVPRKCGIATYTKDLIEGIKHADPYYKAEIFAMVKPEDKIDYGNEVKFKINQNEISSYIAAADQINKSKAEIIVLEHEFGLYGGEFGEYIIKLMKLVQKPIIVTAHTIPENIDEGYGPVLKDIIGLSEKIIVMMSQSMEKLIKGYYCPKEKIEIIPHGVPDIPMEPNHKHKKKKGLEDRIILGNINLLSEIKGIEYTIEALRDIKKQFPSILYLIIGQTHPIVLQTAGEKYRNFLQEKIKMYDLQDNVKFINEYISLNELIEWLKIIDIYITPYLDPQQSASGALAYAIGAGKTCISTPYLYAKEVLAEGRGIIIPFRNSEAIKDAVVDVIRNPQKKSAIEEKTYKFGRLMTWQNVALQHLKLFDEVIDKYENIESENIYKMDNLKDSFILKSSRSFTNLPANRRRDKEHLQKVNI
ncbi:MAG: glycosyltransferase family 4 protein [Actinobacteria bacterium]|nr:glycosyltransferase family 4 protein [Actinomycetota bacterium]